MPISFGNVGPVEREREEQPFSILDFIRKRQIQGAVSEASSKTPYDTRLSPPEEEGFQMWKAQNAPNDSGDDYDLRGAYKASLSPDAASGHWPDTYKKPNHPTFSDQSQYAKDVPEKAGSWNDDKFIPPHDMFNRHVSPLETPKPDPQYTPPSSLSDYQREIKSAPRIEDYKPSKTRTVLGIIAGVGAGLSGDPKLAQSTRRGIEYGGYDQAMGEYQKRTARAKSIYDLDAEVEKNRGEFGLNSAKTAAERARQASEEAQAERARRQGLSEPPSWDAKIKADQDLAKINHPEKDTDDWATSLDEKEGQAISYNKKTGELKITRYHDAPDPKADKTNDPTSLREYNAVKSQWETANPGKQYATTYDDWLTKDANRKKPATHVTVGGLNASEANQFSQIVRNHSNDPLVKAADRVGILDSGIIELEKNPSNGAAQQAFAYPYIAALDNYMSSVRQGEYDSLGDAASYSNQFKNVINRIQSNQIVEPSVMLDFAKQAKRLSGAIKTSAKQKAQAYKSQATVLGMGNQWDQYQQGYQQSYNSPTAPYNGPGSPNQPLPGFDAGKPDPLGIRPLLGGKK